MNQILSKIPHTLVLECGTTEVISKPFICSDSSQKNILSDLKIQAVILLIINVNIFKNTSLNQSVLLGNVIIKYAIFIEVCPFKNKT